MSIIKAIMLGVESIKAEVAEHYFKEAEADKDIADDLDGYDDEDDDLGDGNFEDVKGDILDKAIKEDLLELQDLENAQRLEVLNRVRNEKRAIETRIYAIRLMLNISENYETTKDIFYFLRKRLNDEIGNLKDIKDDEQKLVCEV